MGRLSKRRGAISVFLLMIFMVTYVFMGVLVDAGRYRLAQSYVEGALDNASNSLLSSYNQLVFDLYGLFSVDMGTTDEEEMVAQIKEKYEKYLGEVLGIAKIDASEYTTRLADLIFEDDKGMIIDTSSLYDFQTTELNVGTQITLADTANVESQIIEYMKFRAPVDLVGDMNGFLNKINEVLTMKDTVTVALEKNKIMEEYEKPTDGSKPLSQEAGELLDDINIFAKKLYNYSIDPTKDIPTGDVTKSTSQNPYNLMTLVTAFDQALNDADAKYETDRRSAEEAFCTQLTDAWGSLKGEMIENDEAEIVLSFAYTDGEGKTKNFTEVNYFAITLYELQEISKEVKSEAGRRTDGEDFYNTYIVAYETAENTYNSKLESIKTEYENAKQTAVDNLVNTAKKIEDNASSMYGTIASLKSRIESTFGRYEEYVNKMESKVKEREGENDYQIYLTQYGPSIELAKANGGELVKNLDVLLNSRPYLDQMGYGYFESNDKLSKWISDTAYYVMDKRYTTEGNLVEDYTGAKATLEAVVKSYDYDASDYKNASQSKDLYKNPFTAATEELMSSMQGDICVLYSHASYFYEGNYRNDVDVSVGEDISETVEKELESSVDLSEVDKDLMLEHPDWLDVDYAYTAATSTGIDMDVNTDEIDIGFIGKVLELGKNMIEGLGNMLESARDNLYVDAYVMSTFPNYKDWKDWKNNGSSEKKAFNAPYEQEGTSYNASYAEVEYIITGKKGNESSGFGENSVWAMRGKLFTARMLFNSVSVFTDTAKLSQANALCAWAGPFAPLLAVILLAAWAAAESVIDVAILMGEMEDPINKGADGVLIYKGAKDWYFSISGAVKGVGTALLDAAADKLQGEIETIVGSLEQKANETIYEAYTSLQSSADEIFEDIDLSGAQTIADWTGELNRNVQSIEGIDSATLESFSSGLEGVEQVFGQVADIKGTVDTTLLNAKEQATIVVSRMSKAAVEKTKTTLDKLSEKASDKLSGVVDKLTPYGEVQNGGSNSVRMNYKDYLYFFLFTMDQDVKVQRIQSVIQANMRVGGQTSFSMECSPVSVWADLECTMRYMFLSNGIVPESMKRDGRLRFKVISAQSY